MHNLEERIAKERGRIIALDSKLDAVDALISKQRLRLVLNLFDDLRARLAATAAKQKAKACNV